MKKSANTRQIVWAVDPFARILSLQRATAWALKAMSCGQDVRIIPVFVGSSHTPNELAHKQLAKIIQPVKLSGLEPLEVLLTKNTSVRAMTGILLKFARSRKAELIALSTQAKSGPTRLFLGSFAETLSLTSDLPLLIVNPRWTRRSNFRDILFATDFSTESRKAFRSVLTLAKIQGSRVRLYHKIKFEMTPGLETAYAAYPAFKQLFGDEHELKRRQALSWENEARAAGVSIRTEIDRELGGSVTQAILKRARGRACLIALAAHHDPIWRVLLGSTSRNIIREASDPVWVIHP